MNDGSGIKDYQFNFYIYPMVKTTYIIPKSKYFPIEVKYINDFNKLIYNSLQLAQNIDNQKTVNVLRLAFEASRGKF